MKFGRVPLDEAIGAILAHSVATPDGRLRKGMQIDADAFTAMRSAGMTHVTAAKLGPGDIGENDAAQWLAQTMAGPGLEVRPAFTGRANLHAEGAGVLRIDADAILEANSMDPMITVATLPEWQRVEPGTMAATVKIISYAVDGGALDRACDVARGALACIAPAMKTADLIVTELEGAAAGAEAVVGRLERLGLTCGVHRIAHNVEDLRKALLRMSSPLRLVLTASATSDSQDVGPSALIAAGGRLTRFGMPVDPGNLLFLGDLGEAKVIGLPGCARSPALNGADWVLERVICGVPVTNAHIAAMGVGGLLGEIPTRPQPRERRRPEDAAKTMLPR